ncbi:MAG: sulfotransferase family 2 domain-containing protein [Pseudomonadota bacterium]
MNRLQAWWERLGGAPAFDDPDENETHLDVQPWQRGRFFDEHTFFHVHLPKAGGTALTNALAGIVGWAHTIDKRPRPVHYKPNNLSRRTRAMTRLYTGHFLYGQHRYFTQKPIYISSVREPCDRFVSHYRYILQSPDHPAHDRLQGKSIEEAFEIELVEDRGHVTNGQARAMYGKSRMGDTTGAEVVDHVRQNFLLVTPQGRIDKTINSIRRALDLPMIKSGRFNVGSGPDASLTPELRAKLQQSNAIDLEVETWARESYAENLERACDWLNQTVKAYR